MIENQQVLFFWCIKQIYRSWYHNQIGTIFSIGIKYSELKFSNEWLMFMRRVWSQCMIFYQKSHTLLNVLVHSWLIYSNLIGKLFCPCRIKFQCIELELIVFEIWIILIRFLYHMNFTMVVVISLKKLTLFKSRVIILDFKSSKQL